MQRRVKLAVKLAFDIPAFKDIEEFYKTSFYLAKNSGKEKGGEQVWKRLGY